MMRSIRVFVLAAMVILFAVPAWAGPKHRGEGDRCVQTCLRNPDGRTSLTVTAGLGSLEGWTAGGEADLTTYSLALVHPATRDFSLLARWDRSEAEWDGFVGARSCVPALTDWETDTFTLGLRFYFGH